MAKPEYKEISIEDLNRSLIGDRANEIAPQPVQETVSTERASAPVAPLSVPTTTSTVQNAAAPPAAPPAASTTVSSHQKPGVAAPVDVSALARKVTTATNQMQEDLPAPNPEDSAQNMIDTIKEHWQVPATILGTAAGLAVLNHLMKKGGNNPPDDNNPPNNPPNNNSSGNSKTLKERIFGPNVQPIDKSIDIHMNEPSAQNPVAAQQTEAQFIASLSPAEQALYAKAQADKAAPTANISNEPYMSSNNNLFDDMQPTPAQLIEQKRIEKQAAVTQAIQQSLATSNATNAPPQGTTLQPVTPAANAAPEPVLGAPAEPITGAATPTTAAEPITPAEPVATTTETPAAPVATDAERVQALKALEEPATKTTNEKIVEAVTTPKETPKEEFVPRKWPGTSKGGAGGEGWALSQFGAGRKTYADKHAAALEILKDRTNGILTMSDEGGGGKITQLDELNKMYEHYTGKPLPSDKGKIPKEQIAQLHAGIYNELQEAAQGGKLKSLGKGALAAAALLGISEAVQAAQKGNFGPLKEAGFDLTVGALGGPAVMAGQMAMTGQTLASGMTPKGQKEYQNRQEILSRPGVQEHLKYLNVLNPNLSTADFNKRVDAYLATNPNAPKTKLQQFNEQTRQQQIDQTQKEHSSRR